MLIDHRGASPEVHPDAYIAPTAVVCGAVRIARGARVLFGAVVTAEDGAVDMDVIQVWTTNARSTPASPG